jgi:hypothetical protein
VWDEFTELPGVEDLTLLFLVNLAQFRYCHEKEDIGQYRPLDFGEVESLGKTRGRSVSYILEKFAERLVRERTQMKSIKAKPTRSSKRS